MLGDTAALSRALTSATAAYLLTPPNMAAVDYLSDRAQLLTHIVAAVKQSGLKHLVYLSSVGAQHPAGTGPIVTTHRAEQALRGIAPSVTFIRASYFIENWGSVMPVAKAQGVLPHFGDVGYKFNQVSSRDIGEAATSALLNPVDGTRVVELAGKEDWSADDVAATLSELLGKPVKAAGAPVTAAKAGLIAAGMPPGMAALYAEMYESMPKGLMAFEHLSTVTRGSTSLREALKPLV